MESFRQQEQKYRALYDDISVGVVMISPELEVLAINHRIQKWFPALNVEERPLCYRAFNAPPRSEACAFCPILKTLKDGKLHEVEMEKTTPDGIRHYRIVSTPITDSDGRITAAIEMAEDITTQKQTEEKLRETIEELARVNNSLENAIARANEMALEAQAANIAKSQFLANMSHEIRTPMNGVIGMTGLLLDTDLSDEQRHYCETVMASGEALLGVINDILDFSKIEAGKIELEELDFNIRTTLEDTAELLALQAHEKQLEFTCRIDPGLHTFLRGDPGRLRQILVNFGNNAIKFTSRGEVAFDVKLAEEAGDRIKVRFEVRDTGIGIPQDKIDLLFSAFQQVDASTTRRFGGTGLGLAISKRMAELMGGEVGLESVEGQGSTFWFTAVFTRQQTGKQGTEQHPNLTDTRQVRVLAVDDNATNRLILSEQLASWGIRHTEVGSATEALDMLRAAVAVGDPYRVVLTDMQMPDMDGESLGLAIKADPLFHETLIIMMTSLGKYGKMNRFSAMGFSACLTKPVKQAQLYDCLATILGGTEPVKTPETSPVTQNTRSNAHRRQARILLVEDNMTNQQVALRILEKLGYRADAVNNGLEAIEALENALYHIVFMDIQMPVMDGFTATQIIRSGQTKVPDPQIPIIAMTAHAMNGDRKRCIEAGMNDYISKPIAHQALSKALDKWLVHVATAQPSASSLPEDKTPLIGPPVFDREALMDRLMGDEDLVKEICMGFLGDMPIQINVLRQHIGRNDSTSAGGQSHTIKGAAANVGGMALSATALNMEKAAKAGRWDEIASIMSEMERQFDLLKNHMEKNIS